MAKMVKRGRRRAWCHCWNASRTGHLNRSLIDACKGETIAGSCTDQCHTASVLSWSVWERVQREIWRRKVELSVLSSPVDIWKSKL